ncbi:hypothetical protein BGZ63DRAFT_424377 [Mariannaea sp. PMI_226]|nr:hypothetical protein BGZ63DRAFT_424377 [Mariannaea sp. PMI_226]
MKRYMLPASLAGPRSSSEAKPSHSPTTDDTSRADTASFEMLTPEKRCDLASSPPTPSKLKSDDRFRWKEQLMFRAFKSRRRSQSQSKDDIKKYNIVHTTHDGLPKSATVDNVALSNDRNSRAIISRTGSDASMRERRIQQASQENFREPQHIYTSVEGLRDFEDAEHTENEEDPWHLQARLSTATAMTEKMMDMHLHTPHSRSGTALGRMTDSTLDSETSSLQSFLGETQVEQGDVSDADSISAVERSSDESLPADIEHNSWNWAVPEREPCALAPAPPPRPRTLSQSTFASPSSPQLAAATNATAPSTPMRANLVSMRRPSRADNPWSWKLPVPDPSVPKINTVMVRRPSQPLKSKAPPPLNRSKSFTPTIQRSSHFHDNDEKSPLTWSSPRRSSRLEEPVRRPSLIQSPHLRNSRRPSGPDEALGSHPVRMRQSSTAEIPCRMCHFRLAEAWGICQKCEEEVTPAASSPKSQHLTPCEVWHRAARNGTHLPPLQTHQPRDRKFSSASMTSWSSSVASSLHSPTMGTIGASLNTPMTDSLHSSWNRFPPTAQSMIPETEMTKASPSVSPTCRIIQPEIILPPIADTPPPIIPTADLSIRYGLGKRIANESLRPQSIADDHNGDDRNGAWDAYYFDPKNFETTRDRPRTKPAATRDQSQSSNKKQEVALGDYDRSWVNPSTPGPGWI